MGGYALELIEKGKRIDGRKFDEFRPIEIKENVIEKAEGSAQVKLGETEIIAGVKLNVGEPFADTPEQGILIVNTEFTPLASPDFESGPPGEDAIELSRIVDRGIRESKCIELEKLCIIPEEKVWAVFIDIHIINHQGNLLDCASLASLVALLNTKMPELEDDKIIRDKLEKKLPVVFKPINVTVGKVGDKFLLDPNLEEESILETKLSVAIMEDGKVCAMQKQGKKELDISDIEKMIELAMEKSKQIRKMIK
jgi:exosome complex component RRP42